MHAEQGTEELGAVYAASSPEEVARTYDAWAETYESDMARLGYRHPAICVALLCRHLPVGAAPILDAGAGTGLNGELLTLLGYPVIEALDVSQGMLAVAARKGVYARLHEAALGRPLPFADAAFAGVISTGVFTTGHVGAEGLDELVRATRPGGAIVLTVKEQVWTDGFAAHLERLVAAGALEVVEATPFYVSMTGEAGTVPSRGLALRRR
jgi:predicted TPR repeat methyltransferase